MAECQLKRRAGFYKHEGMNPKGSEHGVAKGKSAVQI